MGGGGGYYEGLLVGVLSSVKHSGFFSDIKKQKAKFSEDFETRKRLFSIERQHLSFNIKSPGIAGYAINADHGQRNSL